MLNKKHVLAVAAASVMAFGATSFSTASAASHSAGARAAKTHGMTQAHHNRHRTNMRMQQQSRNWSPLGVPGAAVAGAGAIVGGALATTGAIVGGTTAAVTGYPYGYNRYGYAPGAYDSYAYAPEGYGAYGYAPGGVSVDRGHQFYNGNAAPASQANCAVDGGYGRLDYGAAC